MDDLISRHGVAAWLNNMGYPNLAKAVMDKNRFPNERFGEKGQAMTELINRQKVLDLVRDICIDIMDECETYIDTIDGKIDATDRETDKIYKNLSEVNAILKCNKRIRNGIRQLPPESSGNSEQLEWIPCSERLPEYRQVVLVSSYWGVTVAIRDAVKEDGTDDFWSLLLEDSDTVTRYIYAWMPLPNPWEGEKDDT